ncbi:hypothetical protein CSUB01_11627 [Colletotrichum sublineola]|uniref:Uncharacterized protein n=1 Tax=Colletotrichum sublineola TaxID=1173701 RepID=A0A066XMN6_COLSU|nr:hypothetical protein CSUB01_11627 [Colletotrichum sublineola]
MPGPTPRAPATAQQVNAHNALSLRQTTQDALLDPASTRPPTEAVSPADGYGPHSSLIKPGKAGQALDRMRQSPPARLCGESPAVGSYVSNRRQALLQTPAGSSATPTNSMRPDVFADIPCKLSEYELTIIMDPVDESFHCENTPADEPDDSETPAVEAATNCDELVNRIEQKIDMENGSSDVTIVVKYNKKLRTLYGLLVSSQAMSRASRVWKQMFTGAWAETRGDSPLVLDYTEDHARAVVIIMNIIYLRSKKFLLPSLYSSFRG